MCTSSAVFSISSVSIRVGLTTLSLLPRTTDMDFFKVPAYINLSATTIGISPKFSFYLLSIANAGSGLGRIVSGILGDKFGAITIIAPLNLLYAIMTFVWPFATTKGGHIAIRIIYGFCSGAYVSLFVVFFLMMGDMHDAGRRTGIGMTGTTFGALAGPPISGAIANATGGFKAVGYYAGTAPVFPPTHDIPKNISSYFPSLRIVYPCRCCNSIHHEIPNAWQFTWKILTLGWYQPLYYFGHIISHSRIQYILLQVRPFVHHVAPFAAQRVKYYPVFSLSNL
jgi:MFS family permease